MTIFQDSHHFSRTLGSLWWQSLKTAITSAELWAVFDDNLSRQPSLQQNFGQSLMTIFKDSHHFSRTLGSLWWQSLRTAITSAELWAVFDDNLSRQPSLQQNFRQCLITMFNDSAFFERTLRGRFREKMGLGNIVRHVHWTLEQVFNIQVGRIVYIDSHLI